MQARPAHLAAGGVVLRRGQKVRLYVQTGGTLPKNGKAFQARTALDRALRPYLTVTEIAGAELAARWCDCVTI
jgi:hypothetical protein